MGLTCHLRRVWWPMSSWIYEGTTSLSNFKPAAWSSFARPCVLYSQQSKQFLCCRMSFLQMPSLGTWSLHPSSKKHVMRQNWKTSLLCLSYWPFTSRLAWKWFQVPYVIISWSILEGEKKKGSGIWNYAKRSTEDCVQIEKNVLAKFVLFSSFEKVWIEESSSQVRPYGRPWYDGCFIHLRDDNAGSSCRLIYQ